MNLRYWNRFHTYGLITGIVSVFLCTPLVCLIYPFIDTSSFLGFTNYWEMLFYNEVFRSKALSLAVIPNLIWFYVFLNKRNYNFSMGIILSSAFFIPYVIYINYMR